MTSMRKGDQCGQVGVVGGVPPVGVEGFPGGPSDCSVLVSYADHVAFRLWTGEVRIYNLQYYVLGLS